jgi:hypothetical protein
MDYKMPNFYLFVLSTSYGNINVFYPSWVIDEFATNSISQKGFNFPWLLTEIWFVKCSSSFPRPTPWHELCTPHIGCKAQGWFYASFLTIDIDHHILLQCIFDCFSTSVEV